jgi:hypothetical protein
MATHEPEQLSSKEISAFAEKLAAWGRSLPEKEQPLFSALIGRAAADEGEDVAGFMISLGAVSAAQQAATQAAWQKAASDAAKMAAMTSGTVAAQQTAAQSAQTNMR